VVVVELDVVVGSTGSVASGSVGGGSSAIVVLVAMSTVVEVVPFECEV
jgi:hypothetical protein